MMKLLLFLSVLAVNLNSCSQERLPKAVQSFEGTKAFELAKAVSKEDLSAIERCVKEDSTLLEFSNPSNGDNVLVLAISLEKIGSFEKLLQLGANPNYINPITKYSVLIESIKPFGNQFEWRIEPRYPGLLLQYGADPNYTVDNHSIVESPGIKGLVLATSPLCRAATLDLGLVKLLLTHGANPNSKLGKSQVSAFSSAAERGYFDIVNFFIDSIHVDIHEPMEKYTPVNDNKEVVLYIQDYLVTPYAMAWLKNDKVEIERLKSQYPTIEEDSADRIALIQKLQSMGVDFVNYEYQK